MARTKKSQNKRSNKNNLKIASVYNVYSTNEGTGRSQLSHTRTNDGDPTVTNLKIKYKKDGIEYSTTKHKNPKAARPNKDGTYEKEEKSSVGSNVTSSKKKQKARRKYVKSRINEFE